MTERAGRRQPYKRKCPCASYTPVEDIKNSYTYKEFYDKI